MQDIRPREEPRGRADEFPRATRRVALAAGWLGLILALPGCSSTITTPLPDTTHPAVTSSISNQDREREMDALKTKAATHEQDAERQIENAR